MRFKSSYKVYILGFPAAVVWEVPWGHWVFFEHGVCSSISSLKKNIRRDKERQLLVSFHCILSLSHVPIMTDTGVNLSICLSVCLISRYINLSVFVLLAGEYAGKKTKKNQQPISHHLTDNPNHGQERINHFLDLAPSDLQQSTILTAYCLQAFDYSATKLRVLASSRARISCPTV